MFSIKKQKSLKDIVSEFTAGETITTSALANHFGGSAYDGLLYIFNASDSQKYLEDVVLRFPEQAQNITLIGYDWLGRILGINEKEMVYLFEPGTGSALQITEGLSALFTEEIAQHHDALLASAFYNDWRKSKGASPEYSDCVGYKTPLFLGGADDITNLEVVDLSVYWHLSVQLISKASDKSLGEKIA